ncbi:hypothetical protein BDQ17DRAFT_1414221, partial [Cyathus striatus]
MTFMLIPAIEVFKQNGRSQLTKVMYRDGINFPTSYYFSPYGSNISSPKGIIYYLF